MSILQFTSFILSLPVLFVIYKCWVKQELNMFDFLLVFNILHFAISPLINFSITSYNGDICVKVFLILFIFDICLFLFSLLWNHYYSDRDCIINVTRYIRKIGSIRITKVGYAFIILMIFFVMVLYMPYATLATRMESASQAIEKNYTLKAVLIIMSSLMSIVSMILSLRIVLQYKYGSFKYLDVVLILSVLILLLFFSRRFLIENLLFFLIVFYSICREKINLRFVALSSIAASFVFLVYFPFYNIIRFSPIRMDSNAPFQSLYAIFMYGINHQENSNNAEKLTKERTLGLYDALYNLQKYEKPIKKGDIILSEIDLAVPKFLNPNKGVGSEETLQSMTGRVTDIADSFLLEACGDFGLFGSFVALFLYVSVFILYSLYDFLLFKFTSQKLISLFILYSLYSICWNIEGKYSTTLSWYFSSSLLIVLLFLMSYYKIVFISNKQSIPLMVLKKHFQTGN